MALQGAAIVVAAAYKATMRLTTLLLSRGVGTLRPCGLDRAPLLLSTHSHSHSVCSAVQHSPACMRLSPPQVSQASAGRASVHSLLHHRMVRTPQLEGGCGVRRSPSPADANHLLTHPEAQTAAAQI